MELPTRARQLTKPRHVTLGLPSTKIAKAEHKLIGKLSHTLGRKHFMALFPQLGQRNG